MNARYALLVAPLALLAACGDDTTTYTLTSGTYAVSGATVGTATPGDQCLLIGTYTAAGKQIDITVAGTTATFDLGFPTVTPANTKPTATINGNAIETPVEANYTANLGNCVLRVRRTIVGELTGDDAAALQLNARITIDTNGSDCNGTPYVGTGCESDIHFLATQVP